MKRFAIALSLALAVAAGAGRLFAQSGYDLFQKALAAERADGNLKSAIELYQRVVSEFGADRALTARALLRMAECYEKLGDRESQRIYERIVRDYADQSQEAVVARGRLRADPAPPRAAAEMTLRKAWTGSDADTTGSVSAGGRYLSFTDVQTGNLALRDLATGMVRLLTANQRPWEEFAVRSVISPDERQIAVSWWSNGAFELRLASLGPNAPAAPRRLHTNEDFEYIGPEAWSPDGASIAVQISRKDLTRQIGLVSVATGALRVLKTTDWRGVDGLYFSPDGKHLLYSQPPNQESEDRDLYVLAVDGSQEVAIGSGPSNDIAAGWTPDGSSVLFTSDRTGTFGLWTVAVADGRPSGTPHLIKPDVGQVNTLGLTRAGALYVGVKTGGPDIVTASVDFDAGRVLSPPTRPVTQFVGTNSYPAWSRDGRYLAHTSDRDPGQRKILAIRNVATGEVRELGPALSYFQWPRWSPDGSSLLVQGTDLSGGDGIYRIDAQSAAVEPVVRGGTLPQWSSDGSLVFYQREDPERQTSALIERHLLTGTERTVLASTPRVLTMSVSPDDRFIATVTTDSTTRGQVLSIVPVSAGDPAVLVRLTPPQSISNGNAATNHNVTWTADGRSVVFHISDGGDGTVGVVPVAAGDVRRIALGVAGARGLAIHPDGRRVAFVAVSAPTTREVWVLENFLPGPAR